MKRQQAQYPYNDYYLYIVFHKKEGRRYANLIPINKASGLKRMTISYARYIMSVSEKRNLDKNEHVDHKDDDKLNDDISNLQILTLKENNIKAAKRRGKKFVRLKCPCCGLIFEKPKKETHLQKGGRCTSCSRKCASTFSSRLQYNPYDTRLLKAIDDNVIEEFVSHK